MVLRGGGNLSSKVGTVWYCGGRGNVSSKLEQYGIAGGGGGVY